MLLDINCERAIKPREIISGNDDDPYAKRTALGWGVVGMVALDTCEGEESVGVDRVAAYEIPFSTKKMCHFVCFKTHTKEILNPAQANRMFEKNTTEDPRRLCFLKDQYRS